MFSFFLLGLCCLVVSNEGSISSINTFRKLSRSKRQFENHGCLLPDHPAHGEIKILGQEQEPYLPNSSVILNTIIDYSCKNGFVPKTGGLARAICYQGKWKPAISVVGECVRTCLPVQAETDTLFVKCVLENRIVNCSKAIEGTKIQVTCKPFYELVSVKSNIICRDGSWDRPILPCQPECGMKRVSVQPLIIGGRITANAEYPWVAGIYNASDKSFFAGATVISRYFVLSAAHVFTNRDGDLLDKNDYIVASGKYYQIFEDTRDIYKQTSRIKRIYISDNFNGVFQNYIADFAIVTLEDPFIFTTNVQPVCIDWTNEYESSDLKEDNIGVIAGWGYTDNHGTHAKELKVLEVSYKSKTTCSLPKDFEKRYYTFDKFCAGYNNKHTSVCAGDSGGGLFFQHSNSKFYIRGILILAPNTRAGCDADSPALYTKISQYLSDIEKETKGVL